MNIGSYSTCKHVLNSQRMNYHMMIKNVIQADYEAVSERIK